MKSPAIFAVLVLTACQSAPPVRPEVGTTAPVAQSIQTTQSATGSKSPEIVDASSLLYAARLAQGLPNVTKNPYLKRAAQEHTEYMIATGEMSHKGRGGSNVRDRILSQGYQGCFFAENIAKSAGDVEDVFELWMNSAGHRANITDARAKEYGIYDAKGYWTLVLGSAC